MKKSIESSLPSTTKKIAALLAKEALQQRQRKATVLALQGELGAGKTAFLQGFAKGLGVKEKVLSPTFLIVKHYKLQTKNYKLFYHIDCYRLKSAKELLPLGWGEIISNPDNIVAVEWADRVKPIIPKGALWISLSNAGGQTRRIRFAQDLG